MSLIGWEVGKKIKYLYFVKNIILLVLDKLQEVYLKMHKTSIWNNIFLFNLKNSSFSLIINIFDRYSEHILTVLVKHLFRNFSLPFHLISFKIYYFNSYKYYWDSFSK